MNSSVQFLNILLILCVSLHKQCYTVRIRLVLHWLDQSHYEVTNKFIIAYLALIKRPGIALSHNPFCNLQWLAILWLKNELKVLFKDLLFKDICVTPWKSLYGSLPFSQLRSYHEETCYFSPEMQCSFCKLQKNEMLSWQWS